MRCFSGNFQRKAVLLFLVAIVFFVPAESFAAPSITGTSGTIGESQTVTISGSEFGSKSPAKPYFWAPFDNGSANPSHLGIVQSWSLDSMAYSANEGFNGSGGLKATNSGGVWTGYIDAQNFAWNDWSRKVYLFRRIKRNFDVVNNYEVNYNFDQGGIINWKILRIWGANFTYPDFFMASGNGNMDTEGVDGASSWMDHLGKMDVLRGTKNVWRLDEIEYRSNSAPDLSDGEMKYWVGGDLVAYLPHTTYTDRYFKLRDSSSSGSAPMTMFFAVHGVKANATFPSSYSYWADDVYLDTAWSRVMIGDASTLDGSSHREIQIPTAWSNNSITISSHSGSFSAGQTAYLYVIDSTGAVNASGYPITIGSSDTSTADTTPPTSPSSLTANATSSSSITVSWNPAIDDVGVSSYQVERCLGLSCSNFAQVGTVQNSPFTDSGLTASTGYSYHVRALDAAGNMSSWSNVVGATTQGSPTFSSCSTVTPTNFTDPTFTGYGAPYDVFASNTPLISTQCSSADTHTLTATLGIPGDTTRIVYTKGYYYDPGINDWTSFTGTCTGALNGEWCQGSVATSITDTDISTASAADPSYLVGFTCRSQNGSWKCGCRDTSCSNFYWQVQGAGR